MSYLLGILLFLCSLWFIISRQKVCFGDFNKNLIRQIQFELASGDLASG